MFLESFDKNRRRIGVLIHATDIKRRRRLNSDDELSFLLPIASDDFQDKIQLKGYVRDERGQYYVIHSQQRLREGKKLTAAISCSHVMFQLTDYKMPYEAYITESYGASIATLLDLITSATNGIFTFVLHDTFDLYDVKDWGRSNALQALNDVVKMYRCELEADNFVIHVRKKIGSDHHVQYRFQKNIISANFKEDAHALVTRLFVTMKDDRTWIGQPASILTEEERLRLEAIPGAIVEGKIMVNYLLSSNQAYWASDSIPYFDGEYVEQDIEDPVKLLEAARQKLAEVEIPRLELSISAADLYKIDPIEPKPTLGDRVTCIDAELGMNKIEARITEITEYPYDGNRHSQVTVSNVMGRDFEDIIADLERSKHIVDHVFSGGRIRTEMFEAFAKQAIKEVHASKTEVRYDPRGIILVDKTNAKNQVALTSQGIVVSTDGLGTARTAINSRGVVAEQIVGQLGNFVSMLIGEANRVVQINTKGIAAGHQTFSEAPFQVDMEGNVIANKLTANAARIKSSSFENGDIVGSSINIGNGMFVVDKAGNMRASNGVFRGKIEASSFKGGSIQAETDIDVTRDVRVGNNIYLGNREPLATKGIYFTTTEKIEVNNVAGVVRISGAARVVLAPEAYIGHSNTPDNRVATVADITAYIDSLQQQITNLQNEDASLWAELAKKSAKGHVHTVSTPHNHGNPKNVATGAGPYTTSGDV